MRDPIAKELVDVAHDRLEDRDTSPEVDGFWAEQERVVARDLAAWLKLQRELIGIRYAVHRARERAAAAAA